MTPSVIPSAIRRGLFFLLAVPAACAWTQEPPLDLAPAIESTQTLARDVVSEGLLPGISIALVEGDRVAWTAGFGWADVEKRLPAEPGTNYRVGSISKLFTALALVKLVEEGKLSLERPLDECLPGIGLVNPFAAEAGPILLGHLASHVSGLPREPPRGSYFDDSGSGPEDAMSSLRGTRLVHPPGKVPKYSNIGVSLLGSVIERAAGMSYARHIEERIFRPLGMVASAFRRTERPGAPVATGYMQGAGRSLVVAPAFELATVAAGNLYSSAEDLSKLARMLHAKGEVEGRRVIASRSLDEMLERRYPGSGGSFGIGFLIEERQGEKCASHGGAVYGFSSLFISLPGVGLSVIALANADVSFGPLRRIAFRLLDGALAAKRGAKPPGVEPAPRESEVHPLPPGTLVFRADPPPVKGWGGRLELSSDGRRAALVLNGHEVRLVPAGPDGFLTRDRLTDGNAVILEWGGEEKIAAVRLDGTRFEAFDPGRASPAPPAWADLAGDYGPEFLPFRIRIREGRLVAECETFEYEVLPRDDGTFIFPRGTLYEDEVLRFDRVGEGPARAITVGTMTFERLPKR